MTDQLSQLTAEEKLLISLCRLDFSEGQKSEIRDLMNEIKDWDHFVKLINEHGVIALTAYNIREIGLTDYVPVQAMKVLDIGRMQSIVRNTWLTERWKEVNTILGNAGIKHILLKGMALEHTLYGAKGLRQMNDNDILVKREDSLKAWHLLQQEGFSPTLIKSPLHKKIMVDIGKHLPCLYRNGYAIEIHHKLFDNKTMDGKCYSDPVDDAVEIFIGDTKAWILSKELQLMHLISHFNDHALGGEQQLRLYTDIVLLDKTSKIEISENFLLNPQQSNKFIYRKAAYKSYINSIPLRYRIRYIIGDIFPSLMWMKKRHRCSWARALIYYPQRLGKLLWLLKA
jgi:hypothetical protein